MTSGTKGIDATNPYKRFVTANTFTKAVSDQLAISIVMAVIGVLYGLVMGPIFPPLQDSIGRLMEGLPEGFRGLIGGADMSTPEGWYSGEMYSIVAPLAIVGLAAWSAAKAFAGEVEDKSMGLLMAAPLRRRRLATDKGVAILVHVVIVAAGLLIGTWLGARVAGLDMSLEGIVAINVHIALLGAFFGSVAMLIAILTARKARSVLVAFGVALVGYLWAGFTPLAEELASLAPISPWYHYNGSDPLTNGIDPLGVVVLGGATAALMVAAVALFERRDIPG